MRKSRKISIVLGILGLGGLGAMPFLRPQPNSASTSRPAHEADLPLRGVALHVSGELATSPAVELHDDDPDLAGRPDKLPTTANRFPEGLDQVGPPPEFTGSFPAPLTPVEGWKRRAGTEPTANRLADSIRPASAEAHDPAETRKHRLVDGDTLAKLARRYLGNADRAGEIYDANRDALATPAVLPLGVEIVIPTR